MDIASLAIFALSAALFVTTLNTALIWRRIRRLEAAAEEAGSAIDRLSDVEEEVAGLSELTLRNMADLGEVRGRLPPQQVSPSRGR